MAVVPKKNKLSPLLKYPGGKEKELRYILPKLPTDAEHYFEPFVGGGAVYFAVAADRYFINDKSVELMGLYGLVKSGNEEFLRNLGQIEYNWQIVSEVVAKHVEEIEEIYHSYKSGGTDKQGLRDVISSFVFRNADEFNGLLSKDFNVEIQNFVSELIKNFQNKIVRMAELEKYKNQISHEDFVLNIECAFKSAFYMHFRYLYNKADVLKLNRPFAMAIYYYIREFCYSSMFRYNAGGQFNVPYGGISYNKKSLKRKIEYFSDASLLDHLQKTQLFCMDFQEFLRRNMPQKKDFVFLDPPYDTEFSTYAQNVFGKKDQNRLADYLKNECDGYFMLVIKNSDLISALYKQGEIVKNGRRIKIERFDKKYFVSFQNRNDKHAEHLLITNY